MEAIIGIKVLTFKAAWPRLIIIIALCKTSILSRYRHKIHLIMIVKCIEVRPNKEEIQ